MIKLTVFQLLLLVSFIDGIDDSKKYFVKINYEINKNPIIQIY